MNYSFTPRGVCARLISFEINDGIVSGVSFSGGCNGNLQVSKAAFEDMEYMWEDAEAIYNALYEYDPEAADEFALELETILTDAYDVLLYIEADSNFVEDSMDAQARADIFLAEFEAVCNAIIDAYYSEDWEALESLGYDLEYLAEEIEGIYEDLYLEDPAAAAQFEEDAWAILETLYEEIPELSY